MRSARLSQDVEPSFHWQHNCQPTVLHLRYVCPLGQTTFWSKGLIAESSLLWSIIESRRTYWFLLGSHCTYIASAIKFALITVSSPLLNVSVYSRVLRMGLALARPTGFPSLSHFWAVTRPFDRVPPRGTDTSALRYVVVPHFWGHLKVTVVRVKVMVIDKMVKVRGQVFCRKVLVCGIGSKMASYSLIKYSLHFQMDQAVGLLVGQMPQGQPADSLPIQLKDFSSQG